MKSDIENDLLYLRGSIPWSKNSTVLVKQSIKIVRRKTLVEKIDAKAKEAAAAKGKKK